MALPLPHRCRFACHCLERVKHGYTYYRPAQQVESLREISTPGQQPRYIDDMSILRYRAKGHSEEEECFKSDVPLGKDGTLSPFQFLSLPFEIRRLVFRELLISPGDINFCFIRLQGRLKVESRRVWPQILQTCQQLHDEGRPILYHENTFGLTHTLALTASMVHHSRIHINKHSYECDGAGARFWTQIRQLHVTVRTSRRYGQRGRDSILNNVHRIVEYILDDAAPLRSLRISVRSDDDDEFYPRSWRKPALSAQELLRILKPLTLLRVDGIVRVEIEDAAVSKRIRKAILDVAHPVPNIYRLVDEMRARIKERAPMDDHRRRDLRCVYECDVEKVKRIYAEMMATEAPCGIGNSGGLGTQASEDEEGLPRL